MSRDRSRHRVTGQSRFGPNLEWQQLPVLGAAEQRFRAMVWRAIIAGLALFWGSVALALVHWLG